MAVSFFIELADLLELSGIDAVDCLFLAGIDAFEWPVLPAFGILELTGLPDSDTTQPPPDFIQPACTDVANAKLEAIARQITIFFIQTSCYRIDKLIL
ncbi:MAG: hypothetical protein ABIR84_11800 [Candidatus Nitrotoga sp.]